MVTAVIQQHDLLRKTFLPGKNFAVNSYQKKKRIVLTVLGCFPCVVEFSLTESLAGSAMTSETDEPRNCRSNIVCAIFVTGQFFFYIFTSIINSNRNNAALLPSNGNSNTRGQFIYG